jgi:hypothetical protein
MPNSQECAVLYSGGTDSTCAAAIAAEKYSRVHLLTFTENSTDRSPVPYANVAKLVAKYGKARVLHTLVNSEPLVRFFATDHYLSCLFRYGFFVLSNPGYSSLAWHTRTLVYCAEHGIKNVADGLTRELMQFPGHMDFFNARVKRLYAAHGINYESPVREWKTPYDWQFMDRLLIDRHGYFPFMPGREELRTTGLYLYEKGLMPHPDVKGTALDHAMQHSCYQFILFNIFAFWYCLNTRDKERYEADMAVFFEGKFRAAEELLVGYFRAKEGSVLAGLIRQEPAA